MLKRMMPMTTTPTLSPGQVDLVKQVILKHGRNVPMGAIIALADDLDMTVSQVSRAIDGITSPPPNTPSTPALKRLSTAADADERWQEESPVAHVEAAPGTIYELAFNWPLIQARMNSPYTEGDIAYYCGLKVTEYKLLEQNRMLPSPNQAARISHLLQKPVGELFILAAPELPRSGKGKGSLSLKGLSIIAILRAKARLGMKALADDLQLAGYPVTTAFIGKIERGELKAPKTEQDKRAAQGLAMYFKIPETWVFQQVPAEVVAQSAQNTAKLHEAMRQAVKALPAIGDDSKPYQLLAGK